EELELLLHARHGDADVEGPLEEHVRARLGGDGEEALLIDGGLDLALSEEALGAAAEPVPKEHDGELLRRLEVLGHGLEEAAVVARALEHVGAGYEHGA